jgi:hypothetical protein
MINIRLRKMNYCLNQDSQDYRMRKIEKKSPKDFNRYNPLQVERSSERERYTVQGTRYKAQVKTCLLVYSFTCPLMNNQINHSLNNKGEGTKGRKVQATSISSWLACLLLAACCLITSN